MRFSANQGVVTRLSRTDFFGSRASLTEEKTRRVGGAITESLCALILVENTLLKYTERVCIYVYTLSRHSQRVKYNRMHAQRLSVIAPPTGRVFSSVRLALDPKKSKLFLIQRKA